MKTPEEIKKGLECCAKGNSCRGHCPYDGRSAGIKECTSRLARDALTLIPRWISVKEMLPEKGVFVVVYYGHFIGNLMDVYMWDGECWRSATGYLEDAENITHWMPLPEPPKEG